MEKPLAPIAPIPIALLLFLPPHCSCLLRFVSIELEEEEELLLKPAA